MNKKKIITDVLIIIIAFVLFILWYESKFQYNAIITSSVDRYSVYLISIDKTSRYWQNINRGASDMAELLNLNYTWEAPKEKNVGEQIKIIENAVNSGADALLIAAADTAQISGAINQAKTKGVKIIYVDTPANSEGIATLATDNYNAGVTAGITMISELQASGIRKGSIGIVSTTPENPISLNREKGFRDAIKNDGKYTLLDTRYANEDATLSLAASAAFINENSDLVGLFGTDIITTENIGNAIRASDKDIVGIGFEINNTIQKMINDGYIKDVMVTNPYSMGYLGVAEANAALNGYDTGPSFIDTGVSIINQYTFR